MKPLNVTRLEAEALRRLVIQAANNDACPWATKPLLEALENKILAAMGAPT